jgi:phage-related minor tail protein
MAAQIIAQQITMIIFGTIMKALGVSMPGGGAFNGTGAPSAPAVDFGFTPSFGSGFAKGGVFHGGQLNAYAKGGIVDSPTFFKFANGGQMANGLMGEAGPEAIMPLKRGADGSLGVEANGLRDAMDRDRYSNGGGASILNMSFESTTIGGVEYVSRDQLEQAMAETRRNAARDGAQRGMSMTLDRIQNSSSTRRRIGV